MAKVDLDGVDKRCLTVGKFDVRLWDIFTKPRQGACIMFKIEKDIPLPTLRNRKETYNFSAMLIGDSIFIPDGSYGKNKAFWAAQKHFSRNGKKITSKKENDGIRIWRIE